MSTELYEYNEEVMPIDAIEFSILGNEEVKRMSAVTKDAYGIDIPELYDNFEPKRNGLVDPRMGITDNHLDCATCGLNALRCPGHFGHIEFAEPVFHAGYIRFLQKILSCICLRCSKLLVYKNEEEIADMLKTKSGKARFNEIRNLAKKVTYCQKAGYGCGTPVSKITLSFKKSAATIELIAVTDLKHLATEEAVISAGESSKKIKQKLTPDICYDILKNISDDDCRIMGLDPKTSRPENMILKIFPVPPVQVRPSVKADFSASSTSEDDLTHKLADIIKANIRIRKYKEATTETATKVFNDHSQLLQYNVATYYDNDSLSLPKSENKGRPIKSLSSRLKGKEGRIRGNLMGKRRNHV